MTRAETTKFLGQLLVSTRIGGAGSHWASEVSIDPWTSKAKRVDYMEFCPANQYSVSGIEKGIFTCYEIKSCKEDVYSGNGLNFFGGNAPAGLQTGCPPTLWSYATDLC